MPRSTWESHSLMLFGILQSFVHFPIFIYHILSGLNIQTNPMQSTFDDVVWQEGTSKWFQVENNWNVLFLFFLLLLFCFFYTSHICLFIFQCLFSSLTVSCWSDTLESDPRDTRFCISWPPNHSWWVFWMDWSHKLFLESVRKKSRKHAWILQLPPTVK